MKNFFIKLAYVMAVTVGVGIISIGIFIYSGNKIYATNVFFLGLFIECFLFVIIWRFNDWCKYFKGKS